MKVVFFGSDRFSRICFQKFTSLLPLLDIKVACPPNTKGELLQLVKDSNIPHEILPPKTLKHWNLSEQFDLGLSASIGYFIPERIIQSFPMGILNAHPSILPKYRGASPIQYTILNCDNTAGVSIIDLDTKSFDAGNIWLQERIPIQPYQSFKELEETLAILAGEQLAKVISNFPFYQSQKREQTGSVSLASKINREDALISPTSMTPPEIFARFQAIGHQERLYSHLIVKDNIEVYFVNILDPRSQKISTMNTIQFNELDKMAPLGATFFERSMKILWIKCIKGWLGVDKFRIQGKSNDFSAGDFLNAAKLSNFSIAHFK